MELEKLIKTWRSYHLLKEDARAERLAALDRLDDDDPQSAEELKRSNVRQGKGVPIDNIDLGKAIPSLLKHFHGSGVGIGEGTKNSITATKPNYYYPMEGNKNALRAIIEHTGPWGFKVKIYFGEYSNNLLYARTNTAHNEKELIDVIQATLSEAVDTFHEGFYITNDQ